MHELFLTALVSPEHVAELLQILQGLCAMTPGHKYEHHVVYEGPKAPPLVPISAPMLQGRKPADAASWHELNEQLIRQSYYITLSYDIDNSRMGSHQGTKDSINGGLR
jgi:mediator of RNA polymerase II transcription subunit 18